MNGQYELFFGRLGQNPDLKYTGSQEPICSLSVAVNKKKDDPPIWKQVKVWGKQAELCSLQLKKGSEVFVHGYRKIREFVGRDGKQRTLTEIHAKGIGFTN